MLQGAYTALVTPFKDNWVDFDQLRKNVKHQIDEGIDGVVPVGTTGESPTLSHDEHDKVIETVVEAAAGRVPVIAGTGSNSTEEALRLTKHAREVGATHSLQVAPYYNKPSQEGLYRHFMSIADTVDIPLVIYNIPGRTGVKIELDTLVKLSAHENIVAVKDAVGDLDLTSATAAGCDLTILSGNDTLTLPMLAVGCKGVISVVTNLIPRRFGDMVRTALAGDFAAARQEHLAMFDLVNATMAVGNPVSVKAMMRVCSLDSGQVRPPLAEAEGAVVDLFRKLCKKHGLI